MLLSYQKGVRFEVDLWVEDDGTCEALEFLENLQGGGKREKQDYVTLVTHRIKRMAEHGAIYNGEQSKELDDGIYEFKAPGGARLLWFYDKTRQKVVICTHDFHKPPSNRGYRSEIAKAKLIRDYHENSS